MTREIHIAAVVDDHPRFLCEAVLWVICVQKYTQLKPVVFVANSAPANFLAWCADRGVPVERVGTLIEESPHCNKIIPFKVMRDSELVVTDCDVFCLQDFAFMLAETHVRLPQNNHGNPPFDVFHTILERFGFRPPFEPGLSLFPTTRGRETFALNVSCGVTWIPSQHGEVVDCWEEMAHWLIRNRDAMQQWHVHVDQVGIAMALHELSVPFSHLPAQANAVLQLLPQITSLHALHLTSGHIPQFPEFFGARGEMQVEAVNPRLAEPLGRFNAAVSETWPLIERWSETRDFADNFINPAWKR